MIDIYILVTPAKDEAKNLQKVIDSMLNQNLKPALWVIVNDNSKDNTLDILKKYSDLITWIEYMHLTRDEKEYDTQIGYSIVVKAGIDFAIKHAELKKIKYDYIGILDADIIPDNDYFEKLLRCANDTTSCGIISGRDKTRKEVNKKHILGCARLYHKNCLDSFGGYPITAHVDTVTEIKAKNRGWVLINIDTALVESLRHSDFGKKGYWHSQKNRAQGFYFLNYHPVNALFASIYLSTKYPFYIGLAFFVGYYKSFISRKIKTKDEEIIQYFYFERFNSLKKRLRKLISLSKGYDV